MAELWICVLYGHSSTRTAGIRSKKCVFGHQLFKHMITYTVWKFRKSKITHQKNEIEQNLNRADLSSSLLSVRSYKNIQQWTTDAKPTMYLLYFHSRVARIATQNLSFTTNSAACLLSLTHSTRATHSTTRVHWLPHSALIQSRSIQYESTDSN